MCTKKNDFVLKLSQEYTIIISADQIVINAQVHIQYIFQNL